MGPEPADASLRSANGQARPASFLAASRYEGAGLAAELAAAFALAPAQAEAVAGAVLPELAWQLEQATLSRGGLADLVEAMGEGRHAPGAGLNDPDAVRDGTAVLARLLGSKARSRALAARAARRAGVASDRVEAMLPALALAAMARLAERSQDSLGPILGALPPQGRWSRGNPHADLADILRRRCGAGPYPPAKLRRVVRRALARAGGFRPRGPVRWYVQFMLARPIIAPASSMLARLLRA